jgi:hypothetical protein
LVLDLVDGESVAIVAAVVVEPEDEPFLYKRHYLLGHIQADLKSIL